MMTHGSLNVKHFEVLRELAAEDKKTGRKSM
jgi:hypothetical protein